MSYRTVPLNRHATLRLLAAGLLCALAGCARQPQRDFTPNLQEADTLVRGAELILAEGEPQVAIERCRNAAPRSALPLEGRLTLVRAYQESEQPKAAEAELLACAQQFPSEVGVYRAMGDFYAGTKQRKKALKAFRRVLDFVPADLDAATKVATLEAATGNAAAGEKVLRELLRQKPGELRGSLALVSLLRAQGKTDAAIATLRQAAKSSPESALARTELGAAYQAAGEAKAAEREYKRALELDKNFVPAYNNLAYLYAEKRHELGMAERMARMAASRLPNDGRCLDTLGWILFLQGKTDVATPLLDKAFRQRPNNPTVAYHLGRAYAALGANGPAASVLSRALALGSDFDERDACRKLLDEVREEAAADGGTARRDG